MDSKPFEQQFADWALERWPEENERRRHEWVLAGIRAHTRWGQGKEVSRADLETAAAEVMDLPLGGGQPTPGLIVR